MNKKIIVILLCMLLIAIAVLPASGTKNKDKEKEKNHLQIRDDYFEIPTQAEVIGLKDGEHLIFTNENFVCNIPADIEIDFSFLDYGFVEENIWKVIFGDYNLETVNIPTIRNSGDVPVYIKIWQDDMQFGKTGGEWNVEFGARIGSEEIVYYEPDETIQLPKILDVGETEKLDFFILVKKGFPGTPYTGLLNLWAEDVPQNNPPFPPYIEGTFNGHAETPYVYSFTSTDPDGDEVSYYIKWGDDTITDWTPLQTSGTPYYEVHTWEEGTFLMEAKAIDSNGAHSEWTEITITMPRNKIVSNLFLLELIQKFLSPLFLTLI